MNRNLLLTILLITLPLFSIAQKFKTVTIVEQRSYYLNGGARATLGGKSRIEIKIDLPPRTKSWYYSFTTTPDEKAEMYCSLGWNAFERGEIDKCLELTKKALEIAPNHSVSKFNIALVNLSQDAESTLDDYINALSGLKNES